MSPVLPCMPLRKPIWVNFPLPILFTTCFIRLTIQCDGRLSKPLDAGVLHGDVGVEALGDGVGDQGGALFLEQLDQPLLLRHQRIDLRRLPVEEPRDQLLYGEHWKSDYQVPDVRDRYCIISTSGGSGP